MSQENWPNWLKEATTTDAVVEITSKGSVIWKSGTWHSGTWQDGVWRSGVWENGTWCAGVWESGIWYNGFWKNGTWKFGAWHGGAWYNGSWQNGTWFDGSWFDGTWLGGIWYGGTWRSGEWLAKDVISQGEGRTPPLSGNVVINYKTGAISYWFEGQRYEEGDDLSGIPSEVLEQYRIEKEVFVFWYLKTRRLPVGPTVWDHLDT